MQMLTRYIAVGTIRQQHAHRAGFNRTNFAADMLSRASALRARRLHVERLEPQPELEGNLQSNEKLAVFKAGLFMDKVFPLQISSLDIRPYIMSRNAEAMKKKVAALIPTQLPHQFAVSDIEPHSRDGGSIVYFTYVAPETQEDAKRLGTELVSAVDMHLGAGGGGRNWFDLSPIRSLPVKGVPFSEDIVRMLPSKRIKIEFVGPDLTVEQIFQEFRQFGRILDIEMQPPSNKDTPRWAVVHFTKLRSATSARNCVHGDIVGATKLLLSYVRERHENFIVQWVKDHQKFMIPLAAAALIAAIYAVFDPIREFFVENKTTHRFDLSRIPLFGSVRKAAVRTMLHRGASTGANGSLDQDMSAWAGLYDQKERLVSILNEPPESFVVVTGPRGSGKTKVVEQASQGKQYRIVIDANKLASQPSELEQMSVLARQLGWWPVFNSIIGITNAIDLMVAATTGSKAGISATPESQVRRILECVALVLTKIRHKGLEALDADEKRMLKRHQDNNSSSDNNKDSINNDSEFTPSAKNLPPKEIPVIVLENFMDKDLPFSKIILEWAATVVEAGLAHCIVTTSNISGYHEILRAQPQHAASLISLDDASPMGAVTLLQKQLASVLTASSSDSGEQAQLSNVKDNDVIDAEYQRRMDMILGDQLAAAAGVLGGRLEDLQLFVQKVKAGENINSALEDIIQRSITDIRKYAFANDSEVGQCEHTWSPEQFWYVLSELARNESVEYDRMRNSPIFAGSDNAILGLAEAQLITMVYDNDRPSRIRPGRPVFYSAFNRIVEDPGFSSTMGIKMNKKFIELETAKIRKAEEELALLNVFKTSAESYNTLTSGLALIAASRDSFGDHHKAHKMLKDKGKSGSKSKDADSADVICPEAYIAQALRASNYGLAATVASGEAGGVTALTAGGARDGQPQTLPQSQSWLGWLFGRTGSSTGQNGALSINSAAGASGSEARGVDAEQQPLVMTVIPGIPFELQGRVQFLLRTIHTSQQKIDKWDAESQAKTRCLSSL
ncbi:RNA12 protein-domain-containing protein [Kickxella alabastrina]|uniref:RNA12 protein-domain-containing protein n=1 Tax=Kickxella alabastrina TaxID=61397 RepID=UPI00221E6CE3|nr:RNA12 protein-domain-containing protein [Kickxella alabastrina]KAI7833375.1 RNA12 protein-domain-containing protein [Kickxella alabastrina]